jgi:ABC-2 type transport system permease protein
VSGTRVLGGIDASFAIARVTLTRMLRGRSIWVVIGLCVLPTLWAAVQKVDSVDDMGLVFVTWALLLAILPPVLLAAAIGEEIEERTASYLWSRPIPRWSIVIGKMVALVPILWLALGASVLVPFYVFVPNAAAHGDVAARIGAMAILATLGAAAVTAGLTTIAPRYGTILSIAYLLFIDDPLAAIDASISRMSVIYNAIQIAAINDNAQSLGRSIAWLAGLIAVWVGIAVWRIRRLE